MTAPKSPDFALSGSKTGNVRDMIGAGNQTTLTGTAGTLQKTVVVTVYDKFPQMAFFKVQYTNKGKADLRVTGWSNNRYSISAKEGAPRRPSGLTRAARMSASRLGAAAEGEFQAGEFSRHERDRLRRRNARGRRVAARRGLAVGHVEYDAPSWFPCR